MTAHWPPGDPRARYRRDPIFARLVDNFRGLIRHMEVTPSEMREALTLAAIMESERDPGRFEWVLAIDPRERADIRALAGDCIEPASKSTRRSE